MRPSGPPSDRPRSSRTGSSGSERGERPQNRDRGDRPDRGERPPYRGGRPERRERPQNRDGGDRPDRGERPPYRDDRPDRGERPQNRDRGDRPDRGERPPYRGDRPNRGERPQNRDSGDRPDRGERPPYRGDRPKRGDRPPYRGDRPDRGERPPYRDDRPDRGERPQNRDRGDRPDPGERPPYRGDRPNRGERPQNRDRGDRPDRGERPPYRGDRPKRGDRPPYRGDRPDRGERPQRDGGRPRSGARYVSHALLFHVIKEKVTLDEAIDRSRAFAQLEDRDRRFVRQLVTTCLRRLGQLQLVLRDYLEEPLPPKNLNVKVLLMMGIAEHHFMRSPSHALVSEAVSLARSDEVMRNYQGLVNAVLRKVCDRDKDDLPHLRHNIPRWLAKRWYAVYGDAWLEDLSQAITQAPPTDLGVKPGADLPIISLEEAQVLADAEEERFQASRRADPKDDEIAAEVIVDPKAQDATDTALAEGENATDAASKAPSEVDETPEKAAAETPTDRPGERESQRPSTKHSTEHAQRLRAESSQSQRPRAEHIVATRLPNAALRLAPSQGSIAQLPGYEEGDWWVQDAAAQVPVMMLGDVAGKRVLDLCAAPGGKTLQLAAQGADVTAVDISENRLQRLHENLERCKLTATVVAQDALTFEDEQGFDAILLDAPCSATGTLRRHPELLWQRREDSLLTQRRLQAKLLGRAVRLLKPDGVLVYAVCSLEPEEGIEQVKAALTALPLAISAMPSTPDWLTPLLTTEGFFRSAPQTWAQYGGMDGFFAARLQRRTVEKLKAASPSQPSAGRLRLAQN